MFLLRNYVACRGVRDATSLMAAMLIVRSGLMFYAAQAQQTGVKRTDLQLTLAK